MRVCVYVCVCVCVYVCVIKILHDCIIFAKISVENLSVLYSYCGSMKWYWMVIMLDTQFTVCTMGTLWWSDSYQSVPCVH